MPLIAASAPAAVPIYSGFDYVTVDPQRRRVYAAHTGSQALTIVDADSGKVLGQVRVGPLHGVAVDPETGHVFTGDGTDRSVSEIDPVALKVLRRVDVAGAVDAIAYDPGNGRIYADEDDGTHMYVIDAATMKSVGTVDLPGHKPEYLAVDPKTHDVYQNITDLTEVAVVDATTLAVKRTIPTPEIKGNHPLQFDAAFGHLLVGGQNGIVAAYDTTGKLVGTVAIQDRVDQCSLDAASHELACAGSGKLTIVRDVASGPPVMVGSIAVAPGAHTVGYDPKAGKAWLVWAQPDGDFVQPFTLGPDALRILIVEDDDRISAPVADDLRRQHHAVDVANDGEMGLAYARSGVYDAILLDILLPGANGIDICRTLRSEGSTAIVLMVTARDATVDIVDGLDAGADDYVVKPFDLEELSARLRALHRRSTPVRDVVLRRGELALDPALRLARYGTKALSLTPTEYILLETLMRHPSQVFSRGMLLEKVASLERQTGDEAIKSHVVNLRRKIRNAGCPHDPIDTVYGNGYRLRDANEA